MHHRCCGMLLSCAQHHDILSFNVLKSVCCCSTFSTVIAHAGDGNFHTCIMFDPSNEDQRREAERLNHFMVHSALSMDGKCLFHSLLCLQKCKTVTAVKLFNIFSEQNRKAKVLKMGENHQQID